MFDGFFAHNDCKGKDTNAPVHHHGRWNCFGESFGVHKKNSKANKWILKWFVWAGGGEFTSLETDLRMVDL